MTAWMFGRGGSREVNCSERAIEREWRVGGSVSKKLSD